MNIKESIKHKLQKINVNQIVIWGHKLHSHTHSYIHNAWFKTFNYLNLNTIWLDNNSDISGINFDNSLFLTDSTLPSSKRV